MTVAFDAVTTNAAGAASYTHTPAGTPRGVLLLINVGNADETDTWAPTYGGTAMTEVALSPHQGNSATSDQNSSLHAFFLGASVPTGAQTVALGQTGSETVLNSACYTVTAAGDTEVQDTSVYGPATSAAPTFTLSLGGNSCFCAEVFRAGPNAVTKITPFTNWTADLEEDFGSAAGGIYSYDIIGTSDVSAGWTNDTTDDGLALGVAITESSGGGDNLLADDVESSSELTAPVIGQDHAILANDVESASELSVPVISQEHVILANDVESAAEVSSPLLTDVGSSVDPLLANDVESATSVTSPVISQEHVILANDVESNAELSTPALVEDNGVHDLLSEDIESMTQVTIARLNYVARKISYTPGTVPMAASPELRAFLDEELNSIAYIVNEIGNR